MLLKDGKEFNLEAPENRKELEAFLEALPMFNEHTPVVVKYHPNLLRWSSINGRWESPEARTLPNRQVINRPGKGNETWIYCENYEQHASTNAILTRTPWDFELTGNRSIEWLNKDLAFYLWISTFCGNGEQATTSAVYIFENREAEAKKRLTVEKLEARVKSLILNDDTEGGLSDNKITEMARAYQMPSTLGINESRQKLFNIAQREQNGFNKFLSLLENPGEKDRLITIQKAKELGIVICKGIRIESGTGNNQGWRILDREGETTLIFGKHRKKTNNAFTDHDKHLWEAIEKDNSIYEQIAQAVESRDVVAVED
jgi:hypothetical protein